MQKQQVNPWTWRDALGFSQAWRVEEPRSVVFLSGQAPISPDGRLIGEGDFEAQVRQVSRTSAPCWRSRAHGSTRS